jgi:hypothetical protein
MAYQRDYLVSIDGEVRVHSGETGSDALHEGLARYAGDKRLVYASVSTRGDVVNQPTMLDAAHFRRNGQSWERLKR